jgi:hypothetical protein
LSIDAVALLPFTGELSALDVGDETSAKGQRETEGAWKQVEGPGGASGVWRRLNDGCMVILGITLQAPDADIHEAARQWMGEGIPARVWVLPDTSVPEVETVTAVRSMTRLVGRWVRAGARQRSILEDLGFTREQARTLQRDLMSGDPARIDAVAKTVEERMKGRDPKEIGAILQAFLRGR